ncbi:hypothetical protein H2200_002769 [Cladophialophora chaetospira]|uniref:Hydrophobin n=1 Tax=Cladophialophora chaetospira TaxID=386627 RepID=A0AA39CND2_9EURO|nr:hypothetical protein H2200_002769 [Cladophialophora chaetospira]
MYTFLLVALAASALARPSIKAREDSKEMTVDQASNQCGDDQVMSCCYTFQGDSAGMLDGNTLNLLGGQCSPIPLNVGLQVPITKACGGQQAACCSGNQTGLINVQCVPISV